MKSVSEGIKFFDNNIKQTKMYSLYQLKHGLHNRKNNSRIKPPINNKNTDEKIKDKINDQSNEFICKNSIFNTNIDEIQNNNLKRKRNDEINETDELSNLNISVLEEEQKDTSPKKTKVTSKGLSSLKSNNDSPNKT